MIENLEYRLRDPDDNHPAGRFEVDASKVFIDGVTSGYGPMLDETRRDSVHNLLAKTYDGEGRITVGFDIDMYGRGWKPDPLQRAHRVLAMLGQIEAAAARQGVNDPRIRFTVPFEQFASDKFTISFAQPQGTEQAAAAKIQAGMFRAAGLLPFNGVSAVGHIKADYDADNGFSLYSRKDGFIVPTMWSDLAATPEDGRVELVSGPAPVGTERLAQARLVALIGIIWALDPIAPLD